MNPIRPVLPDVWYIGVVRDRRRQESHRERIAGRGVDVCESVWDDRRGAGPQRAHVKRLEEGRRAFERTVGLHARRLDESPVWEPGRVEDGDGGDERENEALRCIFSLPVEVPIGAVRPARARGDPDEW